MHNVGDAPRSPRVESTPPSMTATATREEPLQFLIPDAALIGINQRPLWEGLGAAKRSAWLFTTFRLSKANGCFAP